MEDWQKDFFQAIEAVASEVGDFCDEVSRGLVEFVDAIVEISEEISEQLESTIASEFDQYLNDLIEPIFEFEPTLEVYIEFDAGLEELYSPVEDRGDPVSNSHPACVGCRHYHGKVYGNNMLVCGMHPYGWDSENCPDWESDQTDESH